MVNSFDWAAWQKDLEPGFRQVYSDLVVKEGTAAADAHGISFDETDPFVDEHMTAYVGDRITQLTRTTKKDVITTLRQALKGADGDLSPGKLRDLLLDTVRQKFEGYESWRALRIARTESGIGYNHGGVLGGLQAGFEKFEVTDGTDDEECAAANGAVWTANKCLEEPLAHPNCLRTFAPYAGDDKADDEE